VPGFFIVLLIGIVTCAVLAFIFRATIRRFVIGTIDAIAAFVMLVSVLISGLIGARWLAPFGGPPTIIGFAIGAAVGFAISAIPLSIIFLLTDIAENTRKS
jgi:hypothetical protein